MPLLTLSDERIALELRNAELNEAADRAWKRHLPLTLLHATAWYLLGLFLFLSSWHATGPNATALMLAGWLIGNLAPITVLVVSWLRNQP